MGHASITTFLRHYLSRHITVDTQAVVRGIQPQHAIMRAACTMSRTIDHRRPRRLTPEQSASVNNHPAVLSLLRRREQLKIILQNPTKHPKYQNVNRKINRERQRQRYTLFQKVKERWKFEQPVRDVEAQLAGIETENDSEVVHGPMLPEQKELVEVILSRPGRNLEEELSRRNMAIRAVTRYCRIEEGGMNPSRLKRSSSRITPPKKTEDVPRLVLDERALEAAKIIVYKEERPTICFVCLGNEKLPTEQRMYSFYTPWDLSKHFKRKHLANSRESESLKCHLCRVDLDNKMHWQRHAYDVHGTIS